MVFAKPIGGGNLFASVSDRCALTAIKVAKRLTFFQSEWRDCFDVIPQAIHL